MLAKLIIYEHKRKRAFICVGNVFIKAPQAP